MLLVTFSAQGLLSPIAASNELGVSEAAGPSLRLATLSLRHEGYVFNIRGLNPQDFKPLDLGPRQALICKFNLKFDAILDSSSLPKSGSPEDFCILDWSLQADSCLKALGCSKKSLAA